MISHPEKILHLKCFHLNIREKKELVCQVYKKSPAGKNLKKTFFAVLSEIF